MRAERAIVRLGIPALLIASCAGAAAVSWHATASEIPSFAFRSHIVLALQVAVLLFYGALLLLVPLVRAIFDGDLPTERAANGGRLGAGRPRRPSTRTDQRFGESIPDPGAHELRSRSMAEGEDKMVDQREDLLELAARLRRERDERIAELPAKLAKEPVKPTPGQQRLLDTQQEFRERIMGKLENIFS